MNARRAFAFAIAAPLLAAGRGLHAGRRSTSRRSRPTAWRTAWSRTGRSTRPPGPPRTTARATAATAAIFGPGWSWTTGHFAGALQLSGDDQVTVGGGFGFPQATANYTVVGLAVRRVHRRRSRRVAAVLSNEIPWGVGPPGGWSLIAGRARAGARRRRAATASPTGSGSRTRQLHRASTCDCVAFDGWTHLAAVIDATAGTLTFYVGGQVRQQAPITRGIWPAPGALYMGRWPSARAVCSTADARRRRDLLARAGARGDRACSRTRPRLTRCSSGAARQPIEVHADVRRLDGGVGERDRAIERGARLVVAPELRPAARRARRRNGSSPRASARAARSAPAPPPGRAAWRPRPRGSASRRATASAVPASRRACRSPPSRWRRRWPRDRAAPRSPPAPGRRRAGGGASPCRAARRPRRSPGDPSAPGPDPRAARSRRRRRAAPSARACCRSSSASSPMISGSSGNRRSSRRASRIASPHSGARRCASPPVAE